jgi:hypothetical protein
MTPGDDDDDGPPPPSPSETVPFPSAGSNLPPLPAMGSLETKAFKPELDPIDVPPLPRPKDRVPDLGLGPGTGQGHRDVLTALSDDEKFHLLAENSIDLVARPSGSRGKLGSMRAVVVGKTLGRAKHVAVRFRQVRLQPHDLGEHVYSASYSYTEFESSLQRQTVGGSKLGVGIPPIFKMDASYSDASAVSTYDRNVTIHFQATQLIPKAQVVFKEGDITLDPEFEEQVSSACSAKAPAQELLRVLGDYGHFVPLSMFLGGRISLHKTEVLKDRSELEAARTKFEAAAVGRFELDAPVEAGGGVEVKHEQTHTKTLTQHAGTLRMELRGGNEDLASSKAGTLGTQWVASVGPSIEWRTIGFDEHSLVPIIAFLPKKLERECKRILRAHFLTQLDCRNTDVVGRDDGEPFGVDISRVKRIVDVTVNYGDHFDGLQWSYEVYGEGGKTTTAATGRDIGAHRGDKETGRPGIPAIKLRPDEELTAIEAGIDQKDGGVLKRIAFVTNRRRWPDETGYYGRGRVDDYKTIRAPRVRGMFGKKSGWVHAVGLSYLGLADDEKWREYLLAMEPSLFPDYDYGIVE